VQLLPGQRGRLHHLLEGRDSGEMPKNLIAGSFVCPRSWCWIKGLSLFVRHNRENFSWTQVTLQK
jgi:hypothetical protein